MKSLSTFRRSLRPLLVAAACLAPSAAHAESLVFKTTFESDQIHADPASITPTSTTWYVHSSKDGTTSSISSGLILNYRATSSAAGVQGIARFTNHPLTLAEVGDQVTVRAKFYTDNIRHLGVGLYNSGGQNPLTTLANSGLNANAVTATTGGTLGWKGYRARLETGTASGNIIARAPQVGSLTQIAYDVAAPNNGDFNSPGPIPIGSVPASTTPISLADGLGAEYRLAYTITRTAADALTISYSIFDSSEALLYSVSGVTSAASALPSAITDTFDALAFGTRNSLPNGVNTISTLWLTEVSVSADNSQVATITTQPFDQTWVPGISGSITVAATGTGALSYQWHKDGSPIPSATSATYTVANPQASDAGAYHVVVTNNYGVATSASANVAINSASMPAFSVHPQSQTVNAGQPLVLSATVSGAPTPSYQWYKGTTAIPGATSPTYTIPATTPADAGTYFLKATNSSGARDSSVATIAIHTEAPAVVTPPQPVTVDVGGTINLTVAASGYPAPTYQWFKDSGTGFVAIPSAVGATYSIPAATTPDAGTYRVQLTNDSGTATSESALVTVNVVLPAITAEPSNVTVALGQPATFSVTATGSAPLSYQWYKDSVAIPGANAASYSINPTNGTSGGTYHVVVNNEGNVPATSTSATLALVVTEQSTVFSTNFANDTLNPETPVITPTATSWYVIAGKNARTSSMGDDPLTPDVVETRPYTLTLEAGSSSAFFETAARFTETPVELSQIGSQLKLTAIFTTQNLRLLGFGLYNSGGVSPKTLNFDDPTLTPDLRTVLGSAGSSAVGAGTQNWVGYRGTLDNLHGSGNVSQVMATRPAQTATLTNRGQDLCLSGSGSATYGEPAGVGISVTKTPATDTALSLVANSTYTLVYTISRTAADQYTIAYQIHEGAGTSGTVLRAATGSTNTAAVPPALGNRPSEVTQSFDALAIGMRNAGNTTPATIPNFVFSSFKVEKSLPVAAIFPSITTDPVNQSVSVGATLTLTASAIGSPTPTYQWYKGGQPIDGATSATYSTTATSESGGTYYVVATNVLGSDTSEVATVTLSGGASAYATWASAQGLTTGVNDGSNQDPDGDGLSNALEFALGGQPLSATSAPRPTFARVGSTYTFTYDVKTDALSEFEVTAQSSTDLATWTNVVHGVGGVSLVTSPLDASTQRVVVTLPAGPARLFARIRAAAID